MPTAERQGAVMARARLVAGMTIDGFRLEERLHQGGMAAIWRVTRDGLALPAVMKTPFLDQKGNLSQLVGFEVEQKIMARVTGEHVPRLIANGDYTRQPYIVMEWIEGPTLKDIMAGVMMPIEDVVTKGAAIAIALGDLHRQHVLHLDLKPANILFRGSGAAVIVDFGLSRHELLPDLYKEHDRKPAGTTAYMAPEQFLGIRSDRRSDIFALGAILYQMATGVQPFGAPKRVGAVRRRVWRDPVPPLKRRPDIPPALQEVILKCIEPIPERRYATAEDLAFDLHNLDIVELTERSARTDRTDLATAFDRLVRSRALLREIRDSARKPPPRAAIVLVAVDLRPGLERMRDALLDAAVSVLANMPGARLACLNVMQTSIVPSGNVDAAGDNIHVDRLARLRDWAAPLQLPEDKVTFHLLEAGSIAAGVVDFARSNAVDHVVVGVPGGATASRLTMQITSQSPCSVTVVRGGEPQSG
mgnify:CR=1 FL=1